MSTMKKRMRSSASVGQLRRRAEARLHAEASDRGAKRVGRPTDPKQQRLLHELEVHHVELEMQNASLQEAHERAEALLRKYTDLYDFAPVGYFSLDRQGRILDVNLTGASLLGVARGALVGRRFQPALFASDRPAFASFLAGVFAKPGKQVWETRLQTARRGIVWVDLHAAYQADTDGRNPYCLVTISDISAFKRAEAAQLRVQGLTAANEEANREIARRRELEASLRKSEQRQRALLNESRILHTQVRWLARHILLAQEEERKKISRELHDEIAQVLAGIMVHLSALTVGAPLESGQLSERIEKVRDLVRESIDVVRRFARDLRPSVLDDFGLNAALRAYVGDLGKRTHLQVQLKTFAGVEALDSASKTVLYRVAQEALTNVVRHARATSATLRLQRTSDGVRLEISDDGQSFSVEKALASKRKGRLGLLGMRERVEMMEGRFAIDSAAGAGTTVRAELPWSVEAHAKPPS